MQELIIASLCVPLIVAVLSIFARSMALLKMLNVAGSLVFSGLLGVIVQKIVAYGPFLGNILYVDHLTAVLLIVVAFLSFTAMLFSVSYMAKEVEHGGIAAASVSRYYALLNIFIFTMVLVLYVENLGLMWVAVEATTLASALLVAFYLNRAAVEAAWKYVMVCTVGICLALLGTIILYYAQISYGGADTQALSWLALRDIGSKLNPALLKLAFAFVLIGYGTKAGLVPMHTWLPDAHSQAPTPVSALLSGALLSCALYVVIRNMIVVQQAVGTAYIQNLLLGFGIISILVAIPFILIQHDLKRLFAYSSVEHVGIITLGLGVGTPLAVYGSLLHVINHAVAKSALFYIAGIIIQTYRTKYIHKMRGLCKSLPMVGVMFMTAMLTITGTPPFNVFASKFTIVWAMFDRGGVMLGLILLLLLAGIFAGMMYYCINIFFGEPAKPRKFKNISQPFAFVAVGLSLSVVIFTGIYLPPWLNDLLLKAAAIVGGQL